MYLLHLVVSIGTALAAAAEPPGFPSNEDLRHFGALNDPRLSPDGLQVLVRITDPTASGARSHLWLIDIGRNTAHQLTYSPESDKTGESRGEWSPDGKSIYFLAHRGEHTQLLRLPLDGGEAQALDIKVPPPVDTSKLTDAIPPMPEGAKGEAKLEPIVVDIESFRVAPRGNRIGFIAKDPQTPGEKKQADAKGDAVWVDHDLHGRRLYLFDPVTAAVTTVAIPPDIRDTVWSHDGSRLFVTQEEPNGASDLGPADSGWLLELSTLAAQRAPALPKSLFGSVWSEDDHSLAFLSQSLADAPPGYEDIFRYDLTTRTVQALTMDSMERSNGRLPFRWPTARSFSPQVQECESGPCESAQVGSPRWFPSLCLPLRPCKPMPGAPDGCSSEAAARSLRRYSTQTTSSSRRACSPRRLRPRRTPAPSKRGEFNGRATI
jgi:hypothetical protein